MTMPHTLRISPAIPATITFARGYIVTMRPYLLFVSGITGLAGMAFGLPGFGATELAVFAACFLSYGFGQALTDCFQTDTDAISSPYRPLTRGAIPRPLTLAVSLAGLIACVSILAWRNPWNLVLGPAAGAGLATYTWFKRRWWGGPWYNAWIVLVLLVMGALAAGWNLSGLDVMFAWTAAGTFFGYANFVLAGYFKDIGADRATGYETIPVRFGRAKAALASDVLAAGLGVSIVGVVTAAGGWHAAASVGGTFLLASAILLIAGQWNLHRNATDDTAHRSVVPVVHAFVAFLAGTAALQRPGWALPILGFYGAFWLVLSRRPEHSQV
jgi:geranylgeranylglycerol-phosphate geranylgeranyltransferase